MSTFWTAYHFLRSPRGHAWLTEAGLILGLAGIGLFAAAALLGSVL